MRARTRHLLEHPLSSQPSVSMQQKLSWGNEESEKAREQATGTTLLLWAALADDLPVVRELLSTPSGKASLHVKSKIQMANAPTGMTPLMVAACFSHTFDVVEALLDAGADVD